MKQKIKILQKTHKYHIMAAAVITGLLAIVFGQVMYPNDKMLPLTTIGGVEVGSWDRYDVADRLHDELGSVPLKLEISNTSTTIDASIAEAGITPDYRKTIEVAHSYSLNERLIPFSFAYKIWQSNNVPLDYHIDDEVLTRFMQQVAKQCDKRPKDASLSLSKEQVALQEARAGQACSRAAVKSAMQDQLLTSNGLTVQIEPTVIPPKRSNEDVKVQIAKAEEIIGSGLTVRSSGGEQWSVPKETLVSWLQVSESDGVLSIATDKEAIKKYLGSLESDIYIDARPTRIIMQDGKEVGREPGKQGQGIDTEITAQRISDTLLQESAHATAWVKLTVLEPETVYVRNYSPTSQGLQAMIEQWDRNNSGRYGIVVQDLSGKGLMASLNAEKDFVPASTYKMFLAYAVLKKVESGDISLETRTNTGMSVRSCINEMIVNSTNFCADALFSLVGYSYAHSFVRNNGFTGTVLDNDKAADGEKHTTVRDEADFLVRLQSGELMNKDHTDYLLGLMKRQIYKGGVPAGVPGIIVANKVGFYGGYKHDVGIIYAKRGTYVLAILSHGGSDGKFADLARRVNELLQ